MRQRYTILTVVDSATQYQPENDSGDPPHVFVLFKGKPNGHVQKTMEALPKPPWLHVQVQELGSYREDDVIAALRVLLPVVVKEEDSMIVMLDWFAAHRTPRVVSFVESRGHVLLFHGGGCTPFTQVNDTHLHAMLQKVLVGLENHLMHGKRVDMHMNAQAGVPSLTREDIMEIVKTAWISLPHQRIANKGYLQTGPLLPTSGPILREQIYKDLRLIWDEIDPPQGDQEMGQKMRDDAKKVVDLGWGSKWSRWADVKCLIQDHDDDDDPVPEGLELATYDTTRGDSDEEDDQQEEGDDDESQAAEDADEVIVVSDGDSDDQDAVALDGADASGVGDDVGDAVGLDVADLTINKAREILIADAKKKGDERLLRKLYSDKRGETVTEKIKATDASLILQRKHEEELIKMAEARAKAKKTRQEMMRDSKQTDLLKAEAQERTVKHRKEVLELEISQRKILDRDKKVMHDQKFIDHWLGVTYPLKLARDLFKYYGNAEHKEQFEKKVKEKAQKGDFDINPVYGVDKLWKVNDNDMITMGFSHGPYSVGAPKAVRCSAGFLNFLEDKVKWCHQKDDKNKRKVLDILTALLNATMPGTFQLAIGGRDRLHQLLEMCDYVFDKTFVLCVIQVSKRFKAFQHEAYFTNGIFTWPPEIPPKVFEECEFSWRGGPAPHVAGTASAPKSCVLDA